jgi:hypothetical protein
MDCLWSFLVILNRHHKALLDPRLAIKIRLRAEKLVCLLAENNLNVADSVRVKHLCFHHHSIVPVAQKQFVAYFTSILKIADNTFRASISTRSSILNSSTFIPLPFVMCCC